PRGKSAPSRVATAAAGLAIAQRQFLRVVRRHDGDAPGNHRGGKQRRCPLAGLCIQVEAGRFETPPFVCRAAPAAARLADVVRGVARPGPPSAQPVVCQFPDAPAPGSARSAGLAGKKSVPGRTPALCPRCAVRISFHGSRCAPRHRRLVAARARRTLLPANLFAAKLTSTGLPCKPGNSPTELWDREPISSPVGCFCVCSV